MATVSATTLTLAQVLSSPHALATLGLPLSASLSDADVRSAYRSAALCWHPDKLTPEQKSDQHIVQAHGAAFIKVCEAFQLIKGESERRKVLIQFFILPLTFQPSEQ